MIRLAGTRTVTLAALAAALIGVTSCGPDTTNAQLAPIARPTTTHPATTATAAIASTTTTISTTTTTTLPRQRTQPIAPPEDPRSAEDNPPIGRIAIPAIDLDVELEAGIRLTTLDRGPGHWPGSAMPGEVGNVVIAGHRTSHGAEFRHLDKLLPGDEMVLTTDDGAFAYHVTATEIVEPDALWIIHPTDTPTATLFACHPLGSTAQRIVVYLSLST